MVLTHSFTFILTWIVACQWSESLYRDNRINLFALHICTHQLETVSMFDLKIFHSLVVFIITFLYDLHFKCGVVLIKYRLWEEGVSWPTLSFVVPIVVEKNI